MELLLLFLALVTNLIAAGRAEGNPPCDSEVFCFGSLLETIQTSGIFDDSKEFVDRPLKDDPSEVLWAFGNLTNRSNASLWEFVNNYTQNAGDDILAWEPPDWVERPEFIDRISNRQFQEWALELNTLWIELGKEISSSVEMNPERHSLVAVPHPFIVPGGRFREYYYWDSYWVIRGLLLCEMNDTTRGMIENMADLVERYGMVPNGGRIYYTRRSQPPLLTQMVHLYYNKTRDMSFLERMLPVLVREYSFWAQERNITIGSQGWVLNHYASVINSPRPESFREDNKTALAATERSHSEVYSDLASGAESGWDFSTRWFSRMDPHAWELPSIRTRKVLPVDLNAILCQNEFSLAEMFTAIGNTSAASQFRMRAEQRQAAFTSIFWDEREGLWRDYDLDEERHLSGFYAASLVPLLWECGPHNLTRQMMAYQRLTDLGVLDYPGGIPTSLIRNSTQQWDFPNAWAPLQWFPVFAWANSSNKTLRDAARSIAQKWVTTTYVGWERNNTMFEKYDCTEVGVPGRGGEYILQTGFGWTNAVVLEFLSLYPDLEPPGEEEEGESLGWIAAVVIFTVVVAVTIPCVLWCWWMYRRGRDKYWARVKNEHLVAASGGRSPSPTVYTNRYIETDGILDRSSLSPDSFDKEYHFDV